MFILGTLGHFIEIPSSAETKVILIKAGNYDIGEEVR